MPEQKTADEVREQYSEGVLEETAEATGATVDEIIEAASLHHTAQTPRQTRLHKEARRQQTKWNKENLEFKKGSEF